MRKFVIDKMDTILPSQIRKFFDMASRVPGCVSLGVGEPDFDTPWHIREEGIYSLEKGNTFYTSNAGMCELKQEISKYLKRRFDLTYDANDEIMVTVGGSEAIDLALRVLVEAGDEVIIPEPSYVAYVPCVKLQGASPVIINLKEEDEFRLTIDALEKAITPKTKVLILPFPNNPTGACLTEEDVKEIARICIKYDLFVITDEIYAELVYNNTYLSIAGVKGMKERCVYINGFSKAYSMTGWRLGYACGPKDVLKAMLKIHQYAIMCAPTTSQYAAIEALKNGDKDISYMKEAYLERKNYLLHFFKEMEIPCFNPKGCFYVFPNISKYGLSSNEFTERLLLEEKVVVVPGNAFGACGEGYLRISYAYSIDDLKIALERIKKFITRLEKEASVVKK